MTKTRVPYGERYWYLVFFGGEVLVYSNTERNFSNDNEHFAMGNYFYTKEEAESMAHQICAVFKGAKVIDVPSEEELKEKAIDYAKTIYLEEASGGWEDGKGAFIDGATFIVSKIVK